MVTSSRSRSIVSCEELFVVDGVVVCAYKQPVLRMVSTTKRWQKPTRILMRSSEFPLSTSGPTCTIRRTPTECNRESDLLCNVLPRAGDDRIVPSEPGIQSLQLLESRRGDIRSI